MTGTIPLWLASALYLWQATNYVLAGNYGMAAAFVGYAAANGGFIWAFHHGA